MEQNLPHNHGEDKHIHVLQHELINDSNFKPASEVFKQLGDPVRVKIFWLLCHYEECVINIAALMGMSSPAVSHHLRSLLESNLIISRRDGKEVYYKAADTELAKNLHLIVEQVMEITCPDNRIDYEIPQEEIIKKVHEYMSEHIADRITIDELSKKFLMNQTTLKKVFKEVYGNSIATHMKIHRMEKATELLTSTNYSILEIANKVGYESQSRFTEVFKDTFKILPTEYRKAPFKFISDIDYIEEK